MLSERELIFSVRKEYNITLDSIMCYSMYLPYDTVIHIYLLKLIFSPFDHIYISYKSITFICFLLF